MTRIILGVMGGIEMHYLDATYYRLNLLKNAKTKMVYRSNGVVTI